MITSKQSFKLLQNFTHHITAFSDYTISMYKSKRPVNEKI